MWGWIGIRYSIIPYHWRDLHVWSWQVSNLTDNYTVFEFRNWFLSLSCLWISLWGIAWWMVPKCWWHENHHFNFFLNFSYTYIPIFLLILFFAYQQQTYIDLFVCYCCSCGWGLFYLFRWGLLNPNLIFLNYVPII